MSNDLRRLLDRHSGRALETMNQLCRTLGLEGYITAVPEGNDGLFTFSAYKGGQTKFFASIRIAGAAYLVEDVQVAEEIRLLKKTRNRARVAPKGPTWS